MKSPKYILFSGILFIAIVTLLFFNIFREYSNEIKVVNKELTGIHKIIRIHNLNIKLKTLRGLTQLKNQDAESLKNILSINENDILKKAETLSDKSIANNLKIIMKNNNIPSFELFQRYTNVIKSLDRLRMDTSQKYLLFFEHDRESYYLMMLSFLKIPEAIEYIGRLRGLVSGVLSGKLNFNEIKNLTEINEGYFLEKAEEIKYLISKLPADKKTLLSQKIEMIMEGFYQLKKDINTVENDNHLISSKEYFLKASKLVEDLNGLFIATENMLYENLLKTRLSIFEKIWIDLAIYLLLIIFASYIIFKFYKKAINEKNSEEKKTKEEQLKNAIRGEFMKNPSLKELCYTFLSKISDYFCALNASLYIYDDNNNKLYLGAVYGVDKKSIKKTLNMHDNIIGEAVKEKNIKVKEVNQDIDMGNVTLKSSKLVTIPLLELKQRMGAIQLLFDKKFDEVDLEFLNEIANLIASYIYKARKDEISKNYIELIDKYVLISKTDYDGVITQVSSYFCELTEYSKEELIGNTHAIIRHPDTTDETIKNLWDTIKQKRVWVGEMKNRKKSGNIFWAYTVITPDLDINGNIIGFTAIRNDITDKKYIEQISITDGLTSLYNRRHFDEIFKKQLNAAKRDNLKLAFAMIDIDKFKQYNDIYGHQEGDEALKSVANVLKNSLKRANDYSFRLGGEEFGLLFSAKSKEDAFMLCEKIKEDIEKLKIEHKGNSASSFLTISMGLVLIYPNHSLTADEIYKLADDALYKAKNGGRNRVEIVEAGKEE